jgi:ABC-type glucose/galactose transport system permease subunit
LAVLGAADAGGLAATVAAACAIAASVQQLQDVFQQLPHPGPLCVVVVVVVIVVIVALIQGKAFRNWKKLN